MIKLDQAKKLNPNDRVIVTATKQEWFVDHVEMQGVLPFVHVWRGTDPDRLSRSVIRPERLHLFDLDTSAETKTEVVQSDDAPSARPTPKVVLSDEDSKIILEKLEVDRLAELDKADAEELVNSDITISNDRLETKFVEEPALTKPARKSRGKAK